jgi:hypothetical protein
MKLLIIALLLTLSLHSVGQPNSKQILEELSSLKDQYGNAFKPTITDSIVIIYIAGLEDPATMGYDKLRGKKFSNPSKVFIVGAFPDMPGTGDAKLNHLKNGLISKYGKDYINILLDGDAALGKLLGTNGLAIIVLRKDNPQPTVYNHGLNRKIFFEALNQYVK